MRQFQMLSGRDPYGRHRLGDAVRERREERFARRRQALEHEAAHGPDRSHAVASAQRAGYLGGGRRRSPGLR